MTIKHPEATESVVAAQRGDLKPGDRVTVTFGRRDASGIVLYKTITGSYNVSVTVEGADEPITTVHTRDEIRAA